MKLPAPSAIARARIAMPSAFDLIITTAPRDRSADLRLLDATGIQLARRRTDFGAITASRQQGLFDLRNYLRNLVEHGDEADRMAEIGVCIAEEVLGEEIFRLLWASESERTLRVQLPGATGGQDWLTAALARVPWEIARPSARRPTLGERNLRIRVVHDAGPPSTQPLARGEDEDLRVLFVFAEAPGSSPLGMRAELRALQRLFTGKVYPRHRVIADFLTHGVTRERLEEQIEERSGYHVVHWSGHGRQNQLELAGRDGERDRLSGTELLGLFTGAGGFIPRLVFLSACHSGDIMRVESWADFFAVARGTERNGRGPGGARDIAIEEPPGFTGTAHALLQGGVPSVVAMRYEVGDDYARELAVEFYDALLAHEQPKSAATALMLARRSLLDPRRHDPARYEPWDHANPVLYGDEHPGVAPHPGRSPALTARSPRLHHDIEELAPGRHPHFVGRTWELADLGARFIGTSTGTQARPVALITGLGGMGKTALLAEALALWEGRFQWVLLYQARSGALGLESTLRDIHLRLMGEQGRYHGHVARHPADAVHRQADGEFAGTARLQRLARNLVRAMRDEAILLVLDNFETNLAPHPGGRGGGEFLRPCQDPAWDYLLAVLAAELRGTSSRVVVTSRYPLAALAGAECHHVRLGPLPAGEAALYLREHPALGRMVLGDDPEEEALAERLLSASRFHPLLMDRLARLAAGGPALRSRLLQALDALEESHGFPPLPALFAATPGDAAELAYLDDALTTSLDHLVRDATPDARRLLWTIAIANDPVGLRLLNSVWSGESYHQLQLRRLGDLLGRLRDLSPEMQAHLLSMPPDLRAQVDAFAPTTPAGPDTAPLLRDLLAAGLVTEAPAPDNPFLSCHELVRERIRAWMEEHPEDRGALTENGIRLAYAERLEAEFHAFRHQNLASAIRTGGRALVYCVQAGDHDRLGSFANALVNSIEDPQLLQQLQPHLEAAAASAPEGALQRLCLLSLADALKVAGRPEESLAYYEQAATLARAALEPGRGDDRAVWSEVAAITTNWAPALHDTGHIEAARERSLESAEASKKAGRPEIFVVSAELEALRCEIEQDRVAEALPQVEERLARVEGWWRQHRAGQTPPEAPDLEYTMRSYGAALDIMLGVHFARRDWEAALGICDAQLEVTYAGERPPERVAAIRMNRAIVLSNLRRFGEATVELEACLLVYVNDPAGRARTLGALASLFDLQGDVAQSIAQARRALALVKELSSPHARGSAHNNLALYLAQSGTVADAEESGRHLLAGFVYMLVSRHTEGVWITFDNYVGRFRRAHAAGTTLVVPRLAELVDDPAFEALGTWIRERELNVPDVQEGVDQILGVARQKGMEGAAAD